MNKLMKKNIQLLDYREKLTDTELQKKFDRALEQAHLAHIAGCKKAYSRYESGEISWVTCHCLYTKHFATFITILEKGAQQ